MKVVVFGVYMLEGMAGTKRVRALLDPLVKDKSIDVLNIVYYHSSESNVVNPSVRKSEGINYSTIGIKGKGIYSFIKITVLSIVYLWKWRAKGKELVFYKYGYPDILSILIILAAKVLGYKIVFDIVENNWATNQNTNIIHKIRTKSSLFFIRRIRFYAHGCIGISKNLIELLTSFAKSTCPVVLIPISVDIDKFSITSKNALTDSINVFWGGSIAFNENWTSTKDGIIELIRAFDETCRTNTFLKITGSGDSKSLEKFKELVSQCKNKSNINFYGFVASETHCRLLSECDIAIMNRVNTKYANDGFPFKLGEYLASGKAVIATRVGDVELYLKNNIDAILIPPSDHSALVDAFNKLYDNHLLISRLGINGRIVAENYFSSTTNSKILYDFFKTIIQKNKVGVDKVF